IARPPTLPAELRRDSLRPSTARLARLAEPKLEERRLVGAAGFEPATPSSQTRCATGLRYAPEQACESHGGPPRSMREVKACVPSPAAKIARQRPRTAGASSGTSRR